MVEAKNKAQVKASRQAGKVTLRRLPERNEFQVYRDLGVGQEQWVARVGPELSDSTTATGKSACSAMGYLLHKLAGGEYDFDPTWRPAPFE